MLTEPVPNRHVVVTEYELKEKIRQMGSGWSIEGVLSV